MKIDLWFSLHLFLFVLLVYLIMFCNEYRLRYTLLIHVQVIICVALSDMLLIKNTQRDFLLSRLKLNE